MKQHLLNSLILLFALIAGTATSWADDVVCYTLTPASGSNNSYAGNCDVEIDEITWNLTGNSTFQPWRIGGKSISNTERTLYSKTAIADDVTKIEVQHGAASSITVNSWTVIVSKNADFSNPVSTLTPSFAANSTATISRPDGKDWSNCYFKFVYNVTVSGSSNKFVEFTKATFYKESGSTPDPVASIDLESNSIEASAAGVSSTIKVTYNNITDVTSEVQFFEADGTTTATYDWVSAEINASNNVAYTIDANTGAARTAYMKVYALDDEANDVYSELITITQAKYEIPTSWAAVTSIADLTASDVFVIVGDNGSTHHALSNDNGTGAAPTAVAVTVANKSLSGTVADNIKWNISGNATDGYTFYPDGDTEKWLYCTNTNNGVRVGTNTNNTFTLDASGYLKHVGTSRYVGIYNDQDWRCYTGNGGNIADQTFAFYKKLAVKFNAEGYATFSSTCAIDYSKAEGWTAWVVTSVSGSAITFSQVTGAVPAGTGVLLMGTAGETVYPEVAASGVVPAVNKLQGITTTTEVVADAFYGLSGAEFVKVNAGTVPAGKALLPAAEVGSVKALSLEFDRTDGINTIYNAQSTKDNVIYDLSGRRVVKPTKGLYIVNGKKVVK